MRAEPAATLPLPMPARHSAASGQRRGLIAARSAALLIALPALLPIGAVCLSWIQSQPETWAHLLGFVLGEALGNTLLLAFGVGLGVTTLGVSLAWLSAACEFPGRRWLDWALALPLALPAYVLAFVYVGLLEYGGTLQTGWRAAFGDLVNFPDYHNAFGASLVLTLALYPYVYLTARAAFLAQGAELFEAARNLGLPPWRAFWRAALPAARPAIIAGLGLALMETLADFGAVSVLGYNTLTTAIYKTWFALYSLPAAAQLASLLLACVALTLILERSSRRQARYVSGPGRILRPIRLSGASAIAALAFQLGVLLLAFVLPIGRLLTWWWQAPDRQRGLLEAIGNTALLGVLVAVVVVLLAMVLSLLERRYPSDRALRSLALAGTLGYAIPGTVLAVGCMLFLIALDAPLRHALSAMGFAWQPALASSLLGMVVALAARFLRIGHAPLEAAAQQLRPALPEAARNLGANVWARLTRLHLPLLKPGLMTALLLVLIETCKEMPATLMLRPAGFDTLAVKIYAMTSEGLWQGAALPSLLLVAVGLLPVYILFRGQRT